MRMSDHIFNAMGVAVTLAIFAITGLLLTFLVNLWGVMIT